MAFSYSIMTSGRKFCRVCLCFGESVQFVEIDCQRRYFEEFGIMELELPNSAVLCDGCNSVITSSLLFRDKVVESTILLKNIIDNADSNDNVAVDDNNVKSEISDDDANGDDVNIWSDGIPVVPKEEKEEEDDEEDLLPLKFVKNEYLKEKKSKKKHRHKRNKVHKHNLEEPKEDKRNALTPEDKLKCELVCLTIDEQLEELQQKSLEKKFLNSLYKCESCFKGFCFEETYTKHMSLHEPANGPYKCDVCFLYFSSKNYFMSHRLRHSKRFRCLLCSVVKCTRKDLMEHFGAEHETDRPKLECEYCGQPFLKQTILRQHINRRHRNTNIRQTCEHCNKTFRTKEILRRHLLQHTTRDLPEKEKRFRCDKCGDCFITPTFLRIHQVKHSSDRNFYCHLCDTFFKSQTILNSHLKYSTRHSDINRTIPCQHCDKKMSSQREVEKHIEKDHLGIANYKCHACPKAYYTNNLLRMHVKRVHENYKPPMTHVCDFCGKTFNVRSTLIGHINTHTGEKPFGCKECNAKFGHSAALYTHIRLVHKKLKRNEKEKFIAV